MNWVDLWVEIVSTFCDDISKKEHTTAFACYRFTTQLKDRTNQITGNQLKVIFRLPRVKALSVCSLYSRQEPT